MIISIKDLENLDISKLIPLVPDFDRPNFNKPIGIEHYRLLAYLSTLFNDTYIADIGTRFGSSAIALSYNANNIVHSYDIVSCDYLNNLQPNILFKQENIWDKIEQIHNYKLVSLDIDPHDGTLEQVMIDYLKHSQYNGIVIMDDIGPSWPNLHHVWNNINGVNKLDITHIGHFSGTGLLDFGMEIKII